jgi:hypothetical protein
MTFDLKKATKLCARLATGDESLRQICRDRGMPAKSTVMEWLLKGEAGDEPFKTFKDQYERARQIGIDEQFDKLQEIVDDGSNDTYVDEKGKVRVDHDVVLRSKLRADTLKWRLSKMAPKKYGDATMIKHADADGDRLPPMTDVGAAAAELAAILEEARRLKDEALEGG